MLVLNIALALYSYEWVTTLDQEVNHIWARKWTLSTWIFVVNRYGSLLLAFQPFIPAWSYKVRTLPALTRSLHATDTISRGLNYLICTYIKLTICSCVGINEVQYALILLQFMVTARAFFFFVQITCLLDTCISFHSVLGTSCLRALQSQHMDLCCSLRVEFGSLYYKYGELERHLPI